MMTTNVEQPEDVHEFKVLLSGPRELKQQLEDFKKVCDAHDKHHRKRCKKRYVHLAIMAKIVFDTSEDELRRLLKSGTRTFLIDMVLNKTDEFQDILERIKYINNEFQEMEKSVQYAIGLAVEIHGDCCRLGRMRNNCSVLIHCGDIMTLTIDTSYKFCCFREIAYVFNLRYYIKTLKLNDELLVGKEVRGTIVKILKDSVAILVQTAGLLNSYEYVELPNQCYSIHQNNYDDLFVNDLEMAEQAGAHFIVVPKIRCKPFMSTLRQAVKNKYKFKIIGALDLEYISKKMLDIIGLVKLLDFLWIPDMFILNRIVQNYIYNDVVPIAKCLKRGIIGSVPLERCSDFKQFEDHEFLWKVDAVYIEKSAWCNRYPLIVKKVLPIRDFRQGVYESFATLKHLSSYQSIVNFITRTIGTIECQAIIMYCRCETAAIALSRSEIYCPVFLAMPIYSSNADLQENLAEEECKMELARSLNLRRNLHTIIYKPDMNECNYKPIEYALEYMRKNCILETGDFIITVEVCKEDGDAIQYGVGEDVVILRAYYLPPPKFTEKFKYS